MYKCYMITPNNSVIKMCANDLKILEEHIEEISRTSDNLIMPIIKTTGKVKSDEVKYKYE